MRKKTCQNLMWSSSKFLLIETVLIKAAVGLISVHAKMNMKITKKQQYFKKYEVKCKEIYLFFLFQNNIKSDTYIVLHVFSCIEIIEKEMKLSLQTKWNHCLVKLFISTCFIHPWTVFRWMSGQVTNQHSFHKDILEEDQWFYLFSHNFGIHLHVWVLPYISTMQSTGNCKVNTEDLNGREGWKRTDW